MKAALRPPSMAASLAEENPTDWLAQEKLSSIFHRELLRLKRRAMSRVWLVLLIDLFITAGLMWYRARKPHYYDASVTFRVVERNPDEDGQGLETKRMLRQYIFEGIFTKQRCLELIKSHRIFQREMRIDPNMAVEIMRENISIHVSRNTFILDDLDQATPRSAVVQITFVYTDPEMALSVVKSLGKLVNKFEADYRKFQTTNLVHQLKAQLDASKTKLQKLWERQSQNQVEQTTADKMTLPKLRLEAENLVKTILTAKADVKEIEGKYRKALMLSSLENQNLGLRFEQVDWGKVPPPKVANWAMAAIVSVLIFIIIFPFIGAVVAAFDSRIYDLWDVERLGMNALGHIPTYQGDTFGSLASRQRHG